MIAHSPEIPEIKLSEDDFRFFKEKIKGSGRAIANTRSSATPEKMEWVKVWLADGSVHYGNANQFFFSWADDELPIDRVIAWQFLSMAEAWILEDTVFS